MHTSTMSRTDAPNRTGSFCANHAEQSALEVGCVIQIQIPPVVGAVVLLRGKAPCQGVQFRRRGCVIHARAKTNHNLQAVVEQRIGGRIGRQVPQT